MSAIPCRSEMGPCSSSLTAQHCPRSRELRCRSIQHLSLLLSTITAPEVFVGSFRTFRTCRCSAPRFRARPERCVRLAERQIFSLIQYGVRTIPHRSVQGGVCRFCDPCDHRTEANVARPGQGRSSLAHKTKASGQCSRGFRWGSVRRRADLLIDRPSGSEISRRRQSRPFRAADRAGWACRAGRRSMRGRWQLDRRKRNPDARVRPVAKRPGR